jgi:hypothetical protein
MIIWTVETHTRLEVWENCCQIFEIFEVLVQ